MLAYLSGLHLLQEGALPPSLPTCLCSLCGKRKTALGDLYLFPLSCLPRFALYILRLDSGARESYSIGPNETHPRQAPPYPSTRGSCNHPPLHVPYYSSKVVLLRVLLLPPPRACPAGCLLSGRFFQRQRLSNAAGDVAPFDTGNTPSCRRGDGDDSGERPLSTAQRRPAAPSLA